MALQQVLVFLLAVVVAVPLFKRLGLGSVLGYLAAGVVIGPSALKVMTDVENIQHVGEFGVVLLLFLIGLELQPTRLWGMRRAVFGMGGVQVAGTALVVGLLTMVLFGFSPSAAFVAGIGLSLSSTAFALQLMAEKNQLTTDWGRASFGILLFQDLAVIPVLAVLPLIGTQTGEGAGSPGLLGVGKMVGALAIVVLAGRFALKPVFRIVASTHSQEVFTASALLIAVGTAELVSAAGLSMALGAFLAGVLLAESEYRHELEADIEPFKGLLLGLFFMSVGMSVKLGLLLERPIAVIGLVLGFILVKILCLTALGRVFKMDLGGSLNMGVVLSEGGEFAFVLFGLGVSYGIMAQGVADMLVVVVALSMAVTPPVSMLFDRFVAPRLVKKNDREFDVNESEESPVIIAGFGRVGQVVGRVLRAKRIPFTAMDSDSEHIDFIKKFGNRVFYGDASRLDLLRAARVDKAKIFVLAIDNVEASVRTAQNVLQHFPNVKIFARARNRQHAYALLDLGIDVKQIMRETWLSSVDMTAGVLMALGEPYSETRQALERFTEHDEELLVKNYKLREDLPALQKMAAGARAELEQLFDRDAASQRRRAG